MTPNDPVILIIIAILGSSGLGYIIRRYFPSSEEETNHWVNITQKYKEIGEDYYDRLEKLENKVSDLEKKISNLEAALKIVEFKYKVAINFAKDLLKFIKNKNISDAPPFIPSQIEKDFKKDEEDNK